MIRGEDHQGDFSIREILLVFQVLVARYDNVKSRCLGNVQQLSILQTLPTKIACAADRMPAQPMCQRRRSIGIEQNFQAAAAGRSSELFAN